MTPFSKAISSFPWLVYDCTVMYFSSAKSRKKTQSNVWEREMYNIFNKTIQKFYKKEQKQQDNAVQYNCADVSLFFWL